MTLPDSPLPPCTTSPNTLVIYGQTKVGKTTLLSKLPSNLIIDLEKGTHYMTALKLEVESIAELAEAGALLRANNKYDFITLDTITELESWCEADATRMFMATPLGIKFKGKSVLELPMGGGYYWLRESYKRWIGAFKVVSKKLILVGHVKDRLVNKDGKEVSATDLDLTGKLKQITCKDADSIGYLYRNENKQLILSFKTSDEITCGSRCQHLKDREFIIADPVFDGNVVVDIITHWELIYPELNK